MSKPRPKMYVTVYPLLVRVDDTPQNNVHIRNAEYSQSDWHHPDVTILIKRDTPPGSGPNRGVLRNAVVNAVQARGLSVRALRYSPARSKRARKKEVPEHQLKLL